MSKKPIKPEDRKVKLSITIDSVLYSKITEKYDNKSKYIEDLIKADIIDYEKSIK
jgi:hypothetical protein